MAERPPLYALTQQAGATFVERAGFDVPDNFGNPAHEYAFARRGAVLFDTSANSKIEVTGPEAASYLHNLCSNDINGMPVGAGCEAFFLTPTARVVAHGHIFHVLLHGDRHAFWIDMIPGQNERMIQHLDRHLISEQVELADRTREFAQFHLAGPTAKVILEKALLDEVPDLEPLQHMVRTFGELAHSGIRRNDPLGLPGYDIVCLASVAPTVFEWLVRAGAKPAGLRTWETLRIEAGTPVYGIDIDENRFCVEVGRTPQAISYNKGCYLGQEPVVMVRDRGQLQRQLEGVILPDTTTVPSGSKLFHNEREVGSTTSSVVSPALGKAIALAYIKRGSQGAGTTLQLETLSGRIPATVAPLPFPGTRA